jgi:hypothetical protein
VEKSIDTYGHTDESVAWNQIERTLVSIRE